MHAFAVASSKPVRVDECHEELKVLLFAIVGGGSDHKQVAGAPGDQLSQMVSLGVMNLASPDRSRHLVRLVHDHEVPVGLLDVLLQILIAAHLVQPGDDQGHFLQGIAGAGGGDTVVGQDLEGQLKSQEQFVLPLLGEVAGTDDQAALQVATQHQLLDEKASHDGLARTWVIGQEET